MIDQYIKTGHWLSREMFGDKLTTECYNCLARNGIRTIEKLAELEDEEIYSLLFTPPVDQLLELRDMARRKLNEKTD